MDTDEFRSILSRSKVGIWTLIETAIKVASTDHGDELLRRRDRIVESLYAPTTCCKCNGKLRDDDDGIVQSQPYCTRDNCNDDNRNKDKERDMDGDRKDDVGSNLRKKSNRNFIGSKLDDDSSKSPLTPESNHRDLSGGGEDGLDPFGGLFDDEQTTIMSMKEQLEDPNQSEDSLVDLLQSLADMDITFQALKETDIGRPVNRMRKHSSSEIRRLVKQLVRKWKETVDEWVKVNQTQATSDIIADEVSPQQSIPKHQHNGHHQVSDFGLSPNPRYGSSSAEENHVEYETKAKPIQSGPRRDAPSRPPPSVPKSASAPPNVAKREPVLDDERLNSARKRLLENYQEAENAKRQRTVQVMDIHEIPKPKKAFFSKNKGGFQGRNR